MLKRSHRIESLREKITDNNRNTITELAKKVYNGFGTELFSDNSEISVVGKGSGRFVIKHTAFPDEVVIKLARSQDNIANTYTAGIVQNAVEEHISGTKYSISGFTLPLIDSEDSESPRWLCFPEADTLAENQSYTLFSFWDQLELDGFTSEDIYAIQNWGMWHKQPYLLDFGYAHPNSDCKMTSIAANVPTWNNA